MTKISNTFEIVAHKTVALSMLDIINDVCAICRNNLNDNCIVCSSEEIYDSKDCISVLGVCGHGYHMHCIKSWLDKKNTKCPLDNQHWEYMSQSSQNLDINKNQTV